MCNERVNVKVEYESTPIRHLAIECPSCHAWFAGWDIVKGDCSYEDDLYGAHCECPKCGHQFRITYDSNIEQSNEFPKFYEQCLKKKVMWE